MAVDKFEVDRIGEEGEKRELGETNIIFKKSEKQAGQLGIMGRYQ